MKGYLGVGNLVRQSCAPIPFASALSDVPLVCWLMFPPLDAATNKVDVIVGGTGLVQSVPVTDGPLTPASTLPASDLSVPVLGTGWPTIPTNSLAQLTPENIAESTTRLRDVVGEGAVTQSGQQLDLDAQVLFDYNQATLTTAGQAAIVQAVTKLKSFNKPGQITVTGHTDSDGDNAANMDLSKRRAQTVADALAVQLGAGYTFNVLGKGETEPAASNDTDAGKALNRRVTILPPQ